MRKKKVSDRRIDSIVRDLSDTTKLLELGYPWYGIPNIAKRAVKILKELKDERKPR